MTKINAVSYDSPGEYGNTRQPTDYVGRIVRSSIGGNIHHLYRITGTVVNEGKFDNGKEYRYTFFRGVPMLTDGTEGDESTITSFDCCLRLDPAGDEYRHDPRCNEHCGDWQHISRDANRAEIPYEWPDTDCVGNVR